MANQISIQTPESTRASPTGPSSEGSNHSRTSTPGLSSHGAGSEFYEPSGIPSTQQLNGSSRDESVTAGQAALSNILDHYIPLGSLTQRLSSEGERYISGTDWMESNDIWLAFHEHLSSRDAGPVAFARTLADNRWIRVYARKHRRAQEFATIRVSVLPDDVGRRYVDRSNPYLRKVLVKLVNELDKSLDAWEGFNQVDHPIKHYSFESNNDDSLFYLFNTLPSPASLPSPVSCRISDNAIQSVFGSIKLPGLQTRLYPYQKRTVATMIKREVEPARALDPRLAPLRGPTRQAFYYDKETGVLLRDGREYDEARGGILGESMGLGKTLICLATIVATKGHWPEIPPQYSVTIDPVRPRIGSLMEMAAAAVGRSRIPWRAVFNDLSRAGEDHDNCVALLEDNVGSYTIPAPVTRHSRRPSMVPQGKTIRLSTATLIIVPQNLLSQWNSEISLHVEEDKLKVLCIESAEEVLVPSANELLPYDILLMSRQRFERELAPTETAKARRKPKGAAKGGCNCSLDEDCHCSTRNDYQSPLKEIHFLRIIMDEGHEFSSSGRQGAAYWALQTLHVDRRWVVSGTPANGLLGVEVGTATYETSDSGNINGVTNGDVLESRRKESALSQERKDLEKLGLIVAGFLQVKPWANSKDEDPADWQKYIMPYKDGRRKVRSLKTLLESLVVRHRFEDIEADIQLPPLSNRVVYLQPSWHDKLSINLFILSLTANAITSERVDEDYMFHPKNRHQLHALITNLRQSGFYWTSFSPEDIAKTLKVSRAYYEEHGCLAADGQEQDRMLIETAFGVGDVVLESASWRSFAELHEMGMFVENFPEEAKDSWSLVPSKESDLVLVGATLLAKAQKWVDSHLYLSDPCHKLADVGSSTMQKLWQDALRKAEDVMPDGPLLKDDTPVKAPSRRKTLSAKTGVLRLTEKQTLSRAKAGPSPTKSKRPTPAPLFDSSNAGESTGLKPALKSALKAPEKIEPVDLIPPDSPLAKTRLTGTASAKLSYLLDRVSILHQNEKILIFYEGDHIAWYIAQALDLLDIRYLIYTRTLSLSRQNAYITTFNTTETFRVLLMNVYQAAHGLHIASASRVFFVNPVWQPNVEAQAIKRAHRIGQTRPVFVETLVLQGTLEDQILMRRKGMTAQEHQKAEKSLLDDDTMSTIIKNARFIPLEEEQRRDVARQVARLQVPQQLFGRVGRGLGDVDDPDQDLIFPTESPKRKGKRKVVGGEGRNGSPTPAPTKKSRNSVGFAAEMMQVDAAEPSNTINGSNLLEYARLRGPLNSHPLTSHLLTSHPQDPGPATPANTIRESNLMEYVRARRPVTSHPQYPGPANASSSRRVGFALSPQDTSPGDSAAAASSSSSRRRVAFATDEQPRRSLFGGPSTARDA